MKNNNSNDTAPFLIKTFLYLIAILFFIVTITTCAKQSRAQSYIGKSYNGIVDDMHTTFKTQVDRCVNDVADDGTKVLYVYFFNQQVTAFAFDFKNECVFYLAITPDTSGHQEFTKHLNLKYIRNPPERWVEHRKDENVIWRFTKSNDKKRSILFVYKASHEELINNMIQEYQNADE